MNVCTFVGRVGRDADLRSTSSGQSVASFSIAVDRRYPKKGEQEPLWIQVAIWGKLADSISEYITKGKLVSVSGRIDLETYEARDGETRTTLKLNASDVTLCGGNKQEAEPKTEPEAEVSDEDIPF